MTIMRDRDVGPTRNRFPALRLCCCYGECRIQGPRHPHGNAQFRLIKLIESGQVTNKYKSLDNGRSVWTFAFPVDVEWYYNTIHRNQSMAVYDINYTNNFDILRRIDNMIAIDNCVAVDLLGQQSTGFYEKRPISSSGGYFQFVTFCAQSKGGRGVASMTARSKHGTSRIVPFLPEGSSVDVPAQLSNYICTEYASST